MKIFQFIVKICVQEIKMVDLIDKSITKWDFNGRRECVKRFHGRILPESVEETFLVSCYIKKSQKSRCQFCVIFIVKISFFFYNLKDLDLAIISKPLASLGAVGKSKNQGIKFAFLSCHLIMKI